MTNVLQPLTLDFLGWLHRGPRPYAEVMDAWRTSCPRLTVWEDAVDAGLVERRNDGDGPLIALTVAGAALISDDPFRRAS